MPDGLTGLATHHELASLGQLAERPLAAVFDIDGLVWVTDWYGFARSDEVLARVASLIASMAKRHSGQTFRVGGDEFISILPSCSHAEAQEFARAVMRAVSDLRLEYHRRDDPSRKHVVLNAIVCKVGPRAPMDFRAVRDWIAETIWKAKGGDAHRVEVLADVADGRTPWDGPDQQA